MALIGNRSVLLKSPGRFLNAGVATYRSAFGNHGMLRNAYQAFDAKAAVPNGHLAPSAWVLPKTAGGMSSINFSTLALDSSGLAVGGVTSTGDASFSLVFDVAAGQLISSGNGTASLSITCDPLLLTASINGEGSTALTLTTNAATLGAEASITGTALIELSVANATILPLDDDSPLRTGTATLTLTGTLVPYAIGSMSGTTEEAGLTPNGISNAVWGKVIESGFSADQIMRLLASFAAGSATGLEGANPQFTGLDGVTLRIDGTYAAGTRTIDALNGG